MNRILTLLTVLVLTGISPVSAMNIYDDPRILLSYMDRSLAPEQDILRVTANVTPDNHLVFQVKTRGEQSGGENSDHFLLRITNGKPYVLLVPIDKEKGDKVYMYEDILESENNILSETAVMPNTFKASNLQAEFSARHIRNGVEFSIPLDVINFGNNFGYDAYTVQASIQPHSLEIDEIYDQARKGSGEVKQYAAITLLNKLCATRKQ